MARPLLTAAEMRAAERAVIEGRLSPGGPVSSLALMERAARAVADVAWAQRREHGFIALAGPGNNGGDAVAAARILRERGAARVRVFLLADRLSDDAAHQLGLYGEVPPASIEDIERALDAPVVVIDGLFGTGLTRALAGEHLRIAEKLAEKRPDRAVVAVDIPSGIDSDTGQLHGAAIRADVTVTFQTAKLGHHLLPGRAYRGELVVADIGVDVTHARAQLVGDDAIASALPPRTDAAHKGTFGHLVVIAGHPDRPGSALLAARAALKTGAGLVTIAAKRGVLDRLGPALVELMGFDAGAQKIDARKVLGELAKKKSAFVIGPSLDADDHPAIRAILAGSDLPAVVDAGALDAFEPRKAPTILTPHPGEMSRLTGLDVSAIERDRPRAARDLAAKTGAIVVLKGAGTVIAEPDGAIQIIATGNPGMATGGTGDVLAGMIGALLAQRVPAPLAAAAGAHLHGLAGDRARDRHGDVSLVASDLIEAIAPALQAVR